MNRTSANHLVAADRRARALELRRAGRTYADIGAATADRRKPPVSHDRGPSHTWARLPPHRPVISPQICGLTRPPTETQRAGVAAKLANMPYGGAVYRSANLRTGELAPVSQPAAADMLNVSERTLRTVAGVKVLALTGMGLHHHSFSTSTIMVPKPSIRFRQTSSE